MYLVCTIYIKVIDLHVICSQIRKPINVVISFVCISTLGPKNPHGQQKWIQDYIWSIKIYEEGTRVKKKGGKQQKMMLGFEKEFLTSACQNIILTKNIKYTIKNVELDILLSHKNDKPHETSLKRELLIKPNKTIKYQFKLLSSTIVEKKDSI
jgi:hypothetical protein